MFAVSPINSFTAATAVSPSALLQQTSNSVSTRQTDAAITVPVANASAANTNSQTPFPSRDNAIASSLSSASTHESNSANSSAAYVAQSISQSDSETEDSQIELTTSYAHFAPAPQYTTFVSYSIVKYRPSDAGLPSAYASTADVTQVAPRSDAVTSATQDYQAYSNTQSRNQSNLLPAAPQLIVAG